MKNKISVLYVMGVAVFLMIIAIVPFSWVVNLRGFPIKSMFTVESLRWWLQNWTANIESSPLFALLIFSAGLGVFANSGLWHSFIQMICRMPVALSRKRRQAMILTVAFTVCYLAVVLFATFSRYEILLGITGTLARSPFWAGFPVLLAIGLGMSGVIYGLASGEYRSFYEIWKAMIVFLNTLSGYWIYLFLISQFLAVSHYIQLDQWIGMSEEELNIFSIICYYVPYLYVLIQLKIKPDM